MKKPKLIVFLFILQYFTLLSAQVKKGDVVYAPDFNNDSVRAQWTKLPNANWVKDSITGNTCLFVNGEGMIHAKVNPAFFKGMKLGFRCKAKAESVSQPSQPYLGIKYMLHYNTVKGEKWSNENNIFGTFDWKELYFSIFIPTDITDVDLSLGLQGCSGKVWFDSLSVTVLKLPQMPAKNTGNNYKIQKTTQYRGVMSPNTSNERDIKTLGNEWHANLIRWQLNLSADKARNKDEYWLWINNKLTELDSVLIACKKYGIKVVIDLHTPPGGRNQSGAMVMFYEKEYNQQFIEIWQTIARKYKGNNTVWGYDLVNEPVEDKLPPDGMDFIETQINAAKAIKEIDTKTPIIFEVDAYDAPIEFICLEPIPISNVIYQVHMYTPGSFTHQGVHDKNTGIAYPGKIGEIFYNKEMLRKVLKPVRDFQLTFGVPIYVGEFSAIRWAPGAAQYLSDCIDIFEEYGWDWTYHAYREWNGWDVEYENGKSKEEPAKKAIENTDRKKVLLKAFAKNIK